MYYLESQGTPWEIGVNHGGTLRAEIAQAYRDWNIENISQHQEAQEKARRMRKYLEDNLPALIEEMYGIAEGADIPFEKIFWLTCFNAMGFVLGECSAMAVRGADGRVVVGSTLAGLPLGRLLLQGYQNRMGEVCRSISAGSTR